MLTLPAILLSVFFLYGCNRDEIISPLDSSVDTPHKLGAYVLSEGSASGEQSRLSFLSFQTNVFSQNITSPEQLGIYANGMVTYLGKFYIVEEGSPGSQGKIYKMDTNGVIMASNSLGKNPYSIAAVNGKAYCTNGPDSTVSVINLNSLNETKRIKVGVFPQEIFALDLKVFVCNTKNLYGGAVDSTISVINSTTDNVIAKIKVNSAPSSLALSRDGFLLAGTAGGNGYIYKIAPSNYVKVDSFFVNALMVKDICVDYLSDDVYFISSPTTITKYNLITRSRTDVISGLPLVSVNGYGYDWKKRNHYIADAINMASNGYLYKYTYTGFVESVFQTGVSPRRVLIRN